MKGRDGKPAPSTDLLVCFPSRAHLALMPKPICSPARPSEPNKRHPTHHRRKSSSRLGVGIGGGGGGVASPHSRNKNKQLGGTEIAEPTSPRITCAGKIKVGPKTSSCKNWQSVMEEIERIHHHNRKNKRKPGWIESLGFKKEVMQFLTCLRSIRMDFRCFGAFPQTDIGSDDEDEDEEEEEEEEDDQFQHNSSNLAQIGENGDEEESKTVFSKRFMVLQENQNNGIIREEQKIEKEIGDCESRDFDKPSIPPPNALLLMRCRSAPTKSWLENKENEEGAEEDEVEKEELGDKKENRKNLRALMDEEKMDKKKEEDEDEDDERLVVMKYDTEFYKISSDIAKETWLVGGTQDLFSRSRSWKR